MGFISISSYWNSWYFYINTLGVSVLSECAILFFSLPWWEKTSLSDKESLFLPYHFLKSAFISLAEHKAPQMTGDSKIKTSNQYQYNSTSKTSPYGLYEPQGKKFTSFGITMTEKLVQSAYKNKKEREKKSYTGWYAPRYYQATNNSHASWADKRIWSPLFPRCSWNIVTGYFSGESHNKRGSFFLDKGEKEIQARWR